MQEVRIDRKMTQQEMADALFISANTLKSKQGGGRCVCQYDLGIYRTFGRCTKKEPAKKQIP